MTTLDASYTQKPITSLRWQNSSIDQKPSGILISGSVDGCIKYWDIAKNKSLDTIRSDTNNDIHSMDISKEGDLIAVGGKEYNVRVYSYEKKTVLMKLDPGDSTDMGHTNRVYSVKFTDNSNLLLSGGWDATVYIWDLRMGKSAGYLYGPHIFGDAIDAKGDSVLTGSFDKKDMLQLWSMSGKKINQTIEWNHEPHDDSSGYIYCTRFEKDNRNRFIIASGKVGTDKNEVRVFNNKGKYELVGKIELNTVIPSIDVMNHKEEFAVASSDGFVYSFTYKTS